MFLDEFATSLRDRLTQTWSPIGRRPIIKRSDADRRVLSTMASLSTSGQISSRHVTGSITSKHVIRMLKQVLRVNPAGFVLVWDGASVHRSKRTRAFLKLHPEIAVERLPAYAPELNPEEYAHGNIKAHNRNVIPRNRLHLRKLLDTGFRRLRRSPRLLLSFFRHAGLSVNQLWQG